MNIEDAIERFSNFRIKLVATLPKFTAQAAMDAKALIQHRIQEAGNNADDVQLGNYTSEPYKKKREKRGRQTAYVDLDFTHTGAGMLNSTGIILEEYSEGIAHVVVGGRDEFTQNKIDWNSERYGDILEISKKEEALLNESFDQYLSDLIEETGL